MCRMPLRQYSVLALVAACRLLAQVNYTVPGNIPAVKQPTGNTCWATAATMLISWKKGPQTIQQAMDNAGVIYGLKVKADSGLAGSEKPSFLQAVGMKAEGPQTYSVAGWQQLLKNYGPLWVTTNEGTSQRFAVHARVMVGISGDGSPSGTFVTLLDPATGSKTSETIQSFTKKMEDIARADLGQGADLRPQVVHY
jgi:hypothetical protein